MRLSNRQVYATSDYVSSLAAIGKARELVNSCGKVIERAVPETDAFDAMGPYPLFQCQYWDKLPEDLRVLSGSGLVSLVLVTDPMLEEGDRNLFGCFDVVRPFKRHFLTDLECPYEQSVSRHHRYYVRKSSKDLELDVPAEPIAYLGEWCQLYEQLMARHACNDFRRFSREAFAQLLVMPEVVLFRAIAKGETVGAQIFLLSGDVAHAHQAAFTSEGLLFSRCRSDRVPAWKRQLYQLGGRGR
ncbi:GNAT family N-acetyltransferase [Verrucomicrobiales bacterium]|nr:GNAT family N-acetyltransferase [Verrucomicrobiales bacterium]